MHYGEVPGTPMSAKIFQPPLACSFQIVTLRVAAIDGPAHLLRRLRVQKLARSDQRK